MLCYVAYGAYGFLCPWLRVKVGATAVDGNKRKDILHVFFFFFLTCSVIAYRPLGGEKKSMHIGAFHNEITNPSEFGLKL